MRDMALECKRDEERVSVDVCVRERKRAKVSRQSIFQSEKASPV